ncbi:lipopolysaccharide heptosyltransferase I [Aliarcobacter butzleri]|uniref:Lipopolysaccharide heptosyltransferase 1 n=1 Tax=Aliarcobacter butzleri TaxID=28197 RepID=A0AAP4UYC5_9BACT|nr:lipopolysaccharide heptosyltransferase I [Aliarcobacter butzleri]MCG3704408.1 lipopolysaccharide heptosyltransferase I [Aliarcobacter butzleri]MCG3709051.1 lipopolysaccharide heptosyltransferase I [Aliarcobacter butzleri]MDN5051642.1 lipopolysaccharide heptosyltransferase I [Aliarcobacter butzleri]MDN5075084.1 lipopolysaccharide heptosyltransferase I [Aliarcobacter butzleri]MDN5116891.1 lipopolysaccharide heptosyltransferase I [Aliarcobacter butzleri]
MMKRIAIIKLSAMGDIIHAMVALQYIKKQYPNLQIDWFVESAFAPILENNPDINEIIKLDLKSIKKDKKEILNQIKLIKKYEKNSYDLVIDAQGLIKSAIVSFFLGKNRVGFSKNSTREKLASFFYTKKVDIAYDKNAIERNVKVLSQALNFEITKDDILNKKPFLFYKNENEVIYEYLSKDKKNVLFVIGASWPSKMYSKEKFAKIINNLDENCLITWGNEAEKDIADFIANISKAKVLPKLDLNSLKAIMSKVDLVIGNDTGPTHMAWALNISSITLFGNTPGYRNTYITNTNKIIESKSIVNPFKLDRNDFSIKEIDENEIINTAKGLLYV